MYVISHSLRVCLQPDKYIKMSLDTSLTISSPEVPPVDAMNQLFTQNKTLEEKIDEILDIVKA